MRQKMVDGNVAQAKKNPMKQTKRKQHKVRQGCKSSLNFTESIKLEKNRTFLQMKQINLLE